MAILQERDARVPVAQWARKHGISPVTYYHCKSKCVGAGVPEFKWLRDLACYEYRPEDERRFRAFEP